MQFGSLQTSGTLSITSKIRTPRVYAVTRAYILGSAAIRPMKPVIRAIIH